MRRLFVSALFALSLASVAHAQTNTVSAAAIADELNLARQNPKLYATFAQELRASFDGKSMTLPGRTRIITHEGTHAVDEAIRFLRSVRPLPAFALSPGMSHGAADHCLDQADGGFSHTGRDGSDPGKRMNRYGNWGTLCGENIAYGKRSARDIVLALIIDDGQRARKHRKNIFNSHYNFVGVAYGPHTRFGSVCTMDFAGAYAERSQPDSLVAKF
jgi:uncharacterized protein YkwD